MSIKDKREIKFRAWVIEDKHMADVLAIDFERKLLRYDGEKYGGGWVLDWSEQSGSLEFVELMQSTGLKDKNGTEIYEGDVVRVQARTGIPHETTVIFENGGFMLREGRELFGSVAYAANPDKNGEVIGNIYENPELLK